jgi:hypothetical protein
LSLYSTPPFGIEGKKAVASSPETARLKKLGGRVRDADQRLIYSQFAFDPFPL